MSVPGACIFLLCAGLLSALPPTVAPAAPKVHALSDDGAVLKGGSGAVRAAADDYRLPEYFTVSSYKLLIKPDFMVSGDVSTFSGEVVIKGTYDVNTKRTTLHAGNNLRIFSVALTDTNNNSVPVLSTARDAEREFLHIDTEFGRIPNSGMTITIGFTGTFTGDMHGFYKILFDEEKQTRLMLATQFEPTMARSAFPCFDEPALKATFQLTVYAPKGYGVLSNTPLDKEASSWASSEATKFVFKTTPKMSPHLLAFLVYPEEAYGPTPFGVVTLSEVTIFSWSMKSDITAGRADFGLLSSPAILNFLEEYVDTPYSLDYINKIDQTVIPGFGYQARENWGLVQYRADRLLVDPQEGTELEKEAVAEFIARELSHGWFGDRVSPAWWDSAWVEEAVDALLQYLCVARQQPSWRLLERLQVEQQQSALARDAASNALPLTHAVSTPTEAAAMLTPFVRHKGASIMQMIRNLMGDENLRQALRSFLKDNTGTSKNGIVTATELGAALEKNKPSGVDLNMRTFLTSWAETPGYPVVTVKRDFAAGSASVTQERFLYSSLGNSKEQYITPLTATHNGRTELHILNGSDIVELKGISSTDWLHLEPVGYYRVNYDAENWELLRKTLESSPEDLAPSSRAQLLDDAQALARGGRLAYDVALRVLATLHRESDLVPWEAALPALRFLERGLAHADERSALQGFTLYILSAVYARVGWGAVAQDGDPHLDEILRSYVLRAACKAGDATCLSNCTALFHEYIDGKKPQPDVRDAVVCYGVQQGTVAEWAKAEELLDAAQGESERRAILKGLGCSTDPDTLKGYLKGGMYAEHVKHNEKPLVFSSVYANAIGVDIALDSLIIDFDEYLQSFGKEVLGTLIQDLAEYLNTDQQITKLRQLAQQHPAMSAELSAAVATASDNALWVASHAQEVISILEDITPPVSATSPTPSPSSSTPSSSPSSSSAPDPSTSVPTTSSPNAALPGPGGSHLGLVACVVVVMVFSSVLVVVEHRKGTDV